MPESERRLRQTHGLVCAHHHLYASLARYLPAPVRTPASFSQIREWVWWRLDRALDLELVRWAALLGAVEALEAGTTAIIDHHSSPNAIDGSLDTIAAACDTVGVRVSCAYEVTDRNGVAGAKEGLQENERFLRGGGQGYVGAHACLTLGDESLDAVCGLAQDLGVGVHIHVAEAKDDIDAGARLEGRTDPSWLLAHGVHLDRPLPGMVIHNPRSNLNHAVGYARPDRFDRVALGTDGIGADMLEEFRLAFAWQRDHDVTASPVTAWGWLQAGNTLMPATDDDVVTWSYPVADPWRLGYTPGVRAQRVEIDGEVVLDEGRSLRVDAVEVRAKAAEQGARLVRRMEEL